MDAKESIKKHYNQISNKSVEERKNSPSINIRNHNNFIKSCLFRKYILPGDKVLDFGIGKGGDFKKYEKSQVDEVYGLDIANRSILDALSRARESCPPRFKLTLKAKDCFSKKFDLRKTFNIISIQFSFHYALAKEEYLDCTLGNIARHLSTSGYVLITIPCKEEILRRKAKKCLSNKFFKIEFLDPDKKDVFGYSYYYSLVDALTECIEYLVDVPEVEKKARELGLELVENTSFDDFFEENVILNQGLLNNMRLSPLSPEEKEVTSLHQVLVFKKIN